MIERENCVLLLGLIIFSIARNIIVECRDCNNTTQGPYHCKCAPYCSLTRIKRCYFTRKRIPLCICKAGHQGQRCDQCKNGWYRNGNFSDPDAVCMPCNCTGNLDLSKVNSCDQNTGKCLICTSKVTGEHCEHCASGFHGDAVVAKNCTSLGYLSSQQGKSKKINKEVIVISTCSVIGVVCIIAIAYLIYQRHNRLFKKGRTPKFWTVEISNRNYDDLDFSLLDPVTDTPFVYRNDTRDFEEALITDETSKGQLRIDIDSFTEDFEDTSF